MWSSKARLGKRKGQFQYSENAVFEKRKFFDRPSSVGATTSFRIWKIFDDRQSAIDLLEQEHTREIMRQGQR